MTDAYYIYAIVARDSAMPTGLVGFGGLPVELISHDNLAAAASVVDPAELQRSTENVLKHEEVVEGLRESVPSLPVRFGTVFADKGAVVTELAKQYNTLLVDLHRLGDKDEFGLTVLWPEAGSDGDVEGSVGGQKPVPSTNLGTPGPGTRYLQKRVAEQRHDEHLRATAQKLSDLLEADLAPFVLDSHRMILPTPRIAMRAAYLLHPSTIEAYHEAFERSRERHPELRFLLTGPWPPYSFVSTSGENGKAFPAGEMARTTQDIQEEVVHG